MEFNEEEAAKVVDASAEFFRAARTLALDLLRRGDSAAKHATVVSASSAAAASDVGGGGGGTNGATAPPAGLGGGVVDMVRGGWAADRSELLAMAKLAVANGVAAMQVVKRCSTAGAGGGAGAVGAAGAAAAAAAAAKEGGGVGRAKLDFGSHSQFPVVKPTFG